MSTLQVRVTATRRSDFAPFVQSMTLEELDWHRGMAQCGKYADGTPSISFTVVKVAELVTKAGAA